VGSGEQLMGDVTMTDVTTGDVTTTATAAAGGDEDLYNSLLQSDATDAGPLQIVVEDPSPDDDLQDESSKHQDPDVSLPDSLPDADLPPVSQVC